MRLGNIVVVSLALSAFYCEKSPTGNDPVASTPPSIAMPDAMDTIIGVGTTVVWSQGSAPADSCTYIVNVDFGDHATRFIIDGPQNYVVLDSAVLEPAKGKSISYTVGAVRDNTTDTAWSAQRVTAVRDLRNGDDVVLIFPNGGEIIDGRKSFNVRWWANGPVVGQILITYSNDNGLSFADPPVVNEVSPDDEGLWGDYPIKPFDISAAGNNYKILLQSYLNIEKNAVSQKTFTITK